METGGEDKKAKKEDPESEDDSFFGDDKVDNKATESNVNKSELDRANPLKVFVGGLPWSIEEATVRADFEECGPIERFDMPLNGEGRPSGNAFIYYKTEEGLTKALEYDGEDYHGRPLKVRRAERQNKGKGDKDKGKGKGKDGKGKGKEGKGKNGKDGEGGGARRNDQNTVFVGGLSYDTPQDQIWRDFEECGKVEAVRMVNNEVGGFKGIAFVVYKDEESVKKALEYDGEDYGGRKLRVHKAGEKPEQGAKGGKGGKGKGDKGKGKKGTGVCYKFKQGTCPHGDQCIFRHEE